MQPWSTSREVEKVKTAPVKPAPTLKSIEKQLEDALAGLQAMRAGARAAGIDLDGPAQPQSQPAPLAGNLSEVSADPILRFPVVGPNADSGWALTADLVAEWTALFPGVDILAECRMALAWVKTNQRKTARGMPKFLVSWITRDVNKGTAVRLGGRSQATAPLGPFDGASIQYAASCALHGHVPPCASFAIHLARRRKEDR